MLGKWNNFEKTTEMTNIIDTRYLEEFNALRCASDLLAAGLFRNPRRVTKACGLFQACRIYHNPDAANTLAIVINESGAPCVSAMLAFRTKWHIMSVCKDMADGWYDQSGLIGNKPVHAIDRLYCYKRPPEETPSFHFAGDVIMIYPNGTKSLSPMLHRVNNNGRQTAINLTLFENADLYPEIGKPNNEYTDHGIIGVRNRVQIYSGPN